MRVAAAARDPIMVLRYYRKRLYGLKYGAVLAMLENQNHACPICRIALTERTAHVDHDHLTDSVRGLLCKRCNLGIGHFDDDPERFIAAAKYLACERETAPPTDLKHDLFGCKFHGEAAS